MGTVSALVLALLALVADSDDTAPFEATKFGLKTAIPKDWPVAERETADRVFVAVIRQADLENGGLAVCELAVAPEGLDDYRTRIDATARRGDRPRATLAKNEIVKNPKGNRLETLWDVRGADGGKWHEAERAPNR